MMVSHEFQMFLEAGVNVNMLQNRRRKVLLSTDGHRGTTPLHLAAASPEEVSANTGNSREERFSSQTN